MVIRPGQAFSRRFQTQTVGGVQTSPDTLPTASFLKNGTVVPGVTVTVTNPSVGVCRFSGTYPGDLADGDTIEIDVSATVSGITGTNSFFMGVARTKFVDQLEDITNAEALSMAELGAAAALAAINLDQLMLNPVDISYANTVHLNSVLGHLAETGAGGVFDRTTDSLEAIRDRGDLSWLGATPTEIWAAATRTLTSASGPSAADIWGHPDRTITGGHINTYQGNTPQSGDVFNLASGGNGFSNIFLGIAAILEDTANTGVKIDMTQVPPARNVTAVTVANLGDCLVSAFVVAAGNEGITGSTWVRNQPNKTDIFRQFALNNPTNPTARQ